MVKRGLRSLSVSELKQELRKLERGDERRGRALLNRKAALQKKMDAVDAELSKLKLVGTGRLRPRNDSNLADALVSLLTGKVLNVTRIAKAVQEAGYKTSSPNFRTIVNQTLIKDKRIKRVGRGQYTAK